MRRDRKAQRDRSDRPRGGPWVLTAAVLGVAGSAFAFTGPSAQTESPADTWRIEASDARIIGGYGDNFAYDGTNVRPIEGHAQMTLDSDAGTAQLEIRLQTTEASGPIRFSADRSFEGEIRIVQRFDTDQAEQARIAEDIFLHGDTGNEAPVMPRIYNYFATWGPSKIWVNGEEVVPMIGSHTMFTEQARGESGKIVDASGQVYSPRLSNKTGFTDPMETEFHYVAHTTEPDQENFPPHSAWIHLHFSDVEVVEKPDGVEIPYDAQ